jgi:HEAT repeat protein
MNKVLLVICLFANCVSVPSFAEHPAGGLQGNPRHILFLMQAGHHEKAITAYKELKAQKGSHDLDLLQEISLILLDQGMRSSDRHIQLLTLLGAGISFHDRAFYIIEEGVNSKIPELQLVSLSLAGKMQTDRALDILQKMMGSSYFILRLEAAFFLAQQKHNRATEQIESLMCKVTDEALPVFPKLYAMIGDARSIHLLRKLMSHPNLKVRLEAVHAAAESGRDDLLPEIRMLSAQHDIAQQEACAYVLGVLKDEKSVARLEKLAKDNTPTVRLAALQALYKLGRQNVRQPIEAKAKEGDIFAISALKDIHGTEDLLASLCQNGNLQIKVNAAIGLLEQRDPRCLVPICEILIKDRRDLEFVKISSPGRGLTAWKVVPSSYYNLKEDAAAFQSSLALRESCLIKAAELPEQTFLLLARKIFYAQQNDLIPVLVQVLENLKSKEAMNLLKEQHQRFGAPLIRNYCNLALIKSREPGPWHEDLVNWVTKQQEADLISLKPALPWEVKLGVSYELSGEETSRLLVEALEVLAHQQEDKGIDILLETILQGNPKNKYGVAGLLIRATQ